MFAGDEVKQDEVPADSVLAVMHLLQTKRPGINRQVIIYSLNDKDIKRYTNEEVSAIFLLSSLAVQSVSACIYERDLHHYMFSVYSYNAYCKSLQGHTDQNVRYWSKYTGQGAGCRHP